VNQSKILRIFYSSYIDNGFDFDNRVRRQKWHLDEETMERIQTRERVYLNAG